MQELYNQIKKDSLKARKEKSPEVKSYTYLLGEIQKLEKAKNSTFDKNAIEAIIKLIQKLEKDTLDTLSKISVIEARIPYDIDLDVYERYLPKQLSKQELHKIISDIIVNLTDTKENINMGIIMKLLKSSYNGQYNGKDASILINQILKGM